MSGKHTLFELKTLFLLLISLLIILSAVMIPANAQDDTWEVYLYDEVNTQIIVINQAGETVSTTPLLNEGEFVHPNGIIFDRAGSRAFFCVQESVDSSDLYQTTIRVVEVGNPTPLYNFDLGETLDCRVSALHHDAMFFTVGVINYDPLGTDIDDERPLWQLLLLDPFFAEVIGEINPNSDELPDDILPDTAYMPVVHRIHFDIVFSMIPYYGGDNVSFPAYLWRRADGADSIEAIDGWGRLSYDYVIGTELGQWQEISVGELIYPRYNDALTVPDNTPIAPANVVELQTNDSVSTIYTNEEAVILDSTFVDNGEAIVLTLLNPDESLSYFELLERDGTINPLAITSITEPEVVAVPNGFVIVRGLQNQEQLIYYPIDGEPREIWSATEGMSIIWATLPTIPVNLPSFAEVLP